MYQKKSIKLKELRDEIQNHLINGYKTSSLLIGLIPFFKLNQKYF